ncbi:MAG TPA: magnesium transporter [Phycisphaerae bacterium]|nr:magnesium transporter [Phycisphaerae bacterium]
MNRILSPNKLNEPIVEHVHRDFTTFNPEWTIRKALASLQSRDIGERIVYFYVVDQDNRVMGVVPTRRLLISPHDRRIRDIMVADVLTIPASATVLDACELFMHHRYLALPVTDDEKRLVGVVDINLFTDEVMTTAERRESDRAFQLIGVHVALGRQVSTWVSFKDRFPWLLCNIVGGILCAMLAGRYESFLDHVIVLALFIPVVLALGESVSMQSMALTLPVLQHRRVHPLVLWVNLRKEFLTAAMLGLASGALVGLIASAWRGDATVGLAIGASICLAVITACLLGVAIPAGVRVMRGDPRIAAGPIVLAVADLATLLFYFNIAGWLLG